MSFESECIDWCGTTHAASTRVSVGARPQSTILPAVVLDISSGVDATIGGTVQAWTVSITAVADTMAAAKSLAVDVSGDFATRARNDGHEVVVDVHPVIQPPVIGEGDEAEPATCTVNTTVYYEV